MPASSSTPAAESEATPDLIVLSNVDVFKLKYDNQHHPVIDEVERQKDDMEIFNHPRIRRAIILATLLERKKQQEKNESNSGISIDFETVETASNNDSTLASLADAYKNVHSQGLMEFLATAWTRWEELEEHGRDPLGYLQMSADKANDHHIPPLVPGNFPLPRDPFQVPSKHVLGQVAYYNTDTVTPIFHDLVKEMLGDTALVRKSVEYVTSNNTNKTPVVYIVPTHPGHHSAYDCFGGYCYLNHAAACADLLKITLRNNTDIQNPLVAVLDIDYHCGNGTASIFYEDPSVLVISIHCHPDYEYPFHSGLAEQIGVNSGVGTTMHIPLHPGTTWSDQYRTALEKAFKRISEYQPNALVISMGLDTYDKDPCAIRRAGFCLKDDDYLELGKLMASSLLTSVSKSIPTIFVQEGGYRMDKVGEAAADVVTSFTAAYQR